MILTSRCLLVPLAAPMLLLAGAVHSEVDFVAEVQPILREHCFECHGPEDPEAGLRLDAREGVFTGGDSGPAVEPGDATASLLYQLVTSDDEDERMPQDEDPLDAAQLAVLRRWIEAGAPWPDGVGARIEPRESHWAYQKPQRPELPAVERTAWASNDVDRFVLARIEEAGLSPSPPAEPARLLRRVHLDLIGLPPEPEELDAFLADPSPEAYAEIVERLLASPHYGERWAVPWLDAARYADSHGYQLDNVRPSWPYRDWVIRALNEDMPFDRFTILQIAGDLVPDASPDDRVATGFHRSAPANLEAGAHPEETQVGQVFDRVNVTASVWLGTTLECAQCHNHKYDPFTQREYYELYAFFNNTRIETALVDDEDGAPAFRGPWIDLPWTRYEAAERRKRNRDLQRASRALEAAIRSLPEADFQAWREQARRSLDTPEGDALPEAIRQALADPAPGERALRRLHERYLATDPSLAALLDRTQDLERRMRPYRKKRSLVMVEDSPRVSHVLKRGNFLVPGAVVEPGTPAVLHPMPEDAPRNRLGLAQWLVSPDNPLTARVFVNRTWQELFGRGLVETPEDLGTRSDPPTHPQLLDWLAVDFVEGGWSMKGLHRQLVMSATYRQSSTVREGDLERDPTNRLLARSTRLRLGAELVRDLSLSVGGLLTRRPYGPPVYPPQPEGFWRMVGPTSDNRYPTSVGKERYRRGLYTVWRRSAPYPSFTSFDAPDRTTSCLRRARTNTPLQALSLLNDPAFLEAAAGFTQRILSEPGLDDVSQRVRFAFRLALSRDPSRQELARLEALFRDELTRLEASPKEARELLEPFSALAGGTDPEHAAWFLVAHTLLNLDETITRS